MKEEKTKRNKGLMCYKKTYSMWEKVELGYTNWHYQKKTKHFKDKGNGQGFRNGRNDGRATSVGEEIYENKSMQCQKLNRKGK